MSSGPAASAGSRWRCGRPAAPAATRAPSVSARIAPAPNSRCLRTLSCFTFGRGASDAGSRDTTRERRRSRGGLASPRISHMRAPSSKRGPTGRRPASVARRRSTRPALAGYAVAALLAALLVAALSGGGAAMAGVGGTGGASGGQSGGNPYRGNGMWIWYVSRSSGGDLARIARKAQRHRIKTVYIKSSDGGDAWSQFTRGLVSSLHSRGLRVCAWQFVYGSHPGAEAKRGAQAVRKGADCLVIDAESSYEGRYAAADKYISKLRRRIGSRFPTALASFPYVDYHPALPVFRLPGARRRAVQPPAGLLAHDRRQRRLGLQAHLHLQPRLQTPHRPARPDVRQPAHSPDPTLPPPGGLVRPRRGELVGLAGDREEGVAGAGEADQVGSVGRGPAQELPDACQGQPG